MPGNNSLNDILTFLDKYSEEQRSSLDELRKNVNALENSDIIHEYELLKSEFDELSKENAAVRERADRLAAENASLRGAVAGQIFDMRMSAIKASRKNLEILFGRYENAALDALSEFEMRARARIIALQSELDRHHCETGARLTAELNDLSRRIGEAAAAERALHTGKAFTDEENRYTNDLANAPMPEEHMKKASRRNNLESFIGSNLINKIGIVLIVIGVIAFLRFSSLRTPNEIKSAVMLLFGAAFIAAGEFMNRKNPGHFSVGCTACGIAALFSTLAVSCFGFGLLSAYPFIALCILITSAAFMLSIRYDSRTIFIFALLGGYMPITAVFEKNGMIYAAMVYFMILNIFSLVSSFRMRRTLCAFVGTLLNIAGTFFINIYTGINAPEYGNAAALVAYNAAAFAIYTAVPIISIRRSKEELRIPHAVMLMINTAFGSLALYMLTSRFFGSGAFGILSLILTAVYAAVGYFAGNNKMRPMFLVTALAFSVMIIPFQFGRAWVSIAWLAEGTLLAVYGILKNDKFFSRCGFPIYALCILGFIIIDMRFILEDVLFGGNFLFFSKYTAITLSAVMITVCFLYKNTKSGFARGFKYLSAAGLWFYIIYISRKVWEISIRLEAVGIFMFLILTFALAFLLLRVRAVRDTGTKIIAYILYSAGLIGALFIRAGLGAGLSPGMKILYGAVIVSGDILCAVAAADFAGHIAQNSKFGIQWYPPIVSVYVIILISCCFMLSFRLYFTDTALTLAYAGAAFISIMLGFVRKFPYLRRFGLALALLSAAKLFILDLSGLSDGLRIVCFFALGASFMAISLVYRNFEKKFLSSENGVKINADGGENDDK
ncbi:MAG: DUF2339 domain-containing protein [Oscillospiraceae bacterium]|nr:DUF2339 domain-containing protein [Oscillospiraceae bacterium]